MTVSTRASTPYCVISGRRDKNASQRGIIYCPGATGTEMSWTSFGVPGTFQDLTLFGFRVVTIDDQLQWGNATHIGRVGTMYTTAQSSFGFNASKVNLFGASAGATPLLNWALANLSKVQSIALVIPAVDIIDIDTNNRVSNAGLDPVTQGPRSAYGGSTPDTGHNPASNASSFAGLPIKIWYSSSDNICVPSTITTFAAACGATTVNMGALGHAITGGFNPDAIRLFFRDNG